MAELLKCKICGMTGPNVAVGIWKSSKGTYHSIPRCRDKLACDSRKPASKHVASVAS